jgi:hypothetical protein
MRCRVATAALCFSLLMLSGSRAGAQGPPTPVTKWQGGFGVLGAGAVGDFATHVEAAGGFAVYLDAALRDSMFSLGGELGWMLYGDTTRTVPLGTLVPEVPDASVDVITENQMLLLHARLRAQRRGGRWRPYADGQVGFTDLFTNTSVEGAFDCTYVPGGPFGSGYSDCSRAGGGDTTNSRDFVFSYGGSAGVMVGFGSPPRIAKLDLAIRYHRGGEAVYLTEGAIQRTGEGIVLDVSRSRTDMVVLYIGMAFGR